MDISIRVIEAEDVTAVTILSAQLGYTSTVQQTAINISTIIDSINDIAYVATHKQQVIGWVHIFRTTRLESGTFVEIGGMVVDVNHRDKGVGKLLVEQAKQWCVENNIHRLVVRSNIKRNDAHLFYESLGFKEIKQQKIFDCYMI
jgi:GNAT superfamily N-acetyltransferase